MSATLELPHELLLRRYGLSMSQLSNHTQQLKRDLDKTITLIVNKSRNGEVQITPATQSKIDTYDRYICDGIFEYLEDKEVISEQQSDALENQMDNQRQQVVGNMTNTNNNNQQNTPPAQQNTNQSQESDNSGGAKIGFWDWK